MLDFVSICVGKSTCDAMSAVVKRTIRLRSLSSLLPIITPERMFEVARDELSSSTLEFIYVTCEDVDYYRRSLAPRYARLKTIPGTQKWHYLAVEDEKRLVTKRFGYSGNTEVLDVLCSPPENPTTDKSDDARSDTLFMKVGDFYGIEMNSTYQIGQVTEIYEERAVAKFLMMKKSENWLYWPIADMFQEVEFSNIITRVQPPEYDDMVDYYKLKDSDLAAVIEEL